MTTAERGGRGAAVGLFRAVTVLHAAMTVVQALAAGAVLQASLAGFLVHQAVGGTLLLVAVAQVAVAVLAWRPGRLPPWPIAIAAGLVVGEVAQVALGFTGVLAVHVPLGVAIVGTAVALAVWAVRARPGPREGSVIAPAAPGTPPPHRAQRAPGAITG
ncbi:hypothetical protein [Actinomycetospora cinnamomea]|uniref:Integral membrane protein n=1 Tax=Actinomycetospora cinnamomea TaxID=663609 RepID=A0A2U1EUQ8_9PSEU|nr:hypothetical protein [Actinomycetospora cinnamomea]PVZ03649.1 hypothetical protein C8D89_1205 [Actinomycetospora cinnamomea]